MVTPATSAPADAPPKFSANVGFAPPANVVPPPTSDRFAEFSEIGKAFPSEPRPCATVKVTVAPAPLPTRGAAVTFVGAAVPAKYSTPGVPDWLTAATRLSSVPFESAPIFTSFACASVSLKRYATLLIVKIVPSVTFVPVDVTVFEARTSFATALAAAVPANPGDRVHGALDLGGRQESRGRRDEGGVGSADVDAELVPARRVEPVGQGDRLDLVHGRRFAVAHVDVAVVPVRRRGVRAGSRAGGEVVARAARAARTGRAGPHLVVGSAGGSWSSRPTSMTSAPARPQAPVVWYVPITGMNPPFRAVQPWFACRT